MLVPVPQGSVAAKETTQKSVARHRLFWWRCCLRPAGRLLFACEKDRDGRSIEFRHHHRISALGSVGVRSIPELANSMPAIALLLLPAASLDCFAPLRAHESDDL